VCSSPFSQSNISDFDEPQHSPSMSVIDPSTKSETCSEPSSVYPPLLEDLDSVPSTSDIDTSTTTSSSSLPSMSGRSVFNPSIKFAPLPEIGPRKRRYHQPLGVAARSQLMRHRRGIVERQHRKSVALAEPMQTREEMEEHRLRVEVLAARHAQFQASANAQEVISQITEDGDDEETTRTVRTQDVDDPLLVLGKMIKDARKAIWRNLSKEKAEDEGRQMHRRGHQMRSRKSDVGPRRPILLRSVTPPLPVPPIPFQGTLTPNTWDEGELEMDHQGTPREYYDTQSSGPSVALMFPSSPAEPPPRPTSPPLPEIFNRVSIST
jgi:hypothetical protein